MNPRPAAPRRAFLLTLGLLTLWAVGPAAAQEPLPATTRLLRFPATNGSKIVFTYAGQIYAVGEKGGTARRLTSGPGYNAFPRFSADGLQLAFTGQYDGNTEVYVMPAAGGEPKRLTTTATLKRDDISDRMGPNNLVVTWKNTQPEVVFRSRMRSFNDFIGALYSVGMDAELPRQLPVPRGGFASFSPDDSKMAYNRVFREFRTWKHYRGGMADDIWILDFKTGGLENITNNPAQDICPMWGPDNHIYFASDRDGRMNLFSYDLESKQTKQLTTFKDFDLKFPSIGQGAIVFEQAGYIWRYDLASGQAAPVPISIKEDFASGRAALVDASKHLESVRPAPDGKRLIVVARGDLFSVPAKDGTPRSLTATSDAHERDASWSPDGKSIAYISDASGENELYVRAQDGKGQPEQITHGADTYYYTPVWSPDSKKLLWSDRLQRLRVVDIASKAVTPVDHADRFEVRDYSWSPDSQWVAWARPEAKGQQKIYLYGLAGGKRVEVTDGWYNSANPVFSDDGKYLLLTSARDFKPIFGDEEFETVYRDMQRVYLVTLAKATAAPLVPLSDEVGQEDKKPDADNTNDKKPDGKGEPPPKKPVVVTVDEDGLKERISALDIPPADYRGLRLVEDRVFYLRRTVGDNEGATELGEEPDAIKSTLASYSLKDRKETALGKVNSYEITFNGRKMYVKIDHDYSVIDLPKDKLEIKDKVKMTGFDKMLDRHAEWKQIYDESWRQMRDFFYSPTMNGANWPALHDKYAALLPFVNNRNDLTYLIGELIGELNNGHSYTGGGERPEVPRVELGLLGAEFSRDAASRAYRIDRILPGENWQEATRSPLTDIGLNVKEGDYLLAINGVPVATLPNLYDALIGTAGKQVTLRVNSRPSDDGARDIVVVPTANEGPLYYLAWVRKNIDYVSKRTDGKVGYVHIPDMGQAGLDEFTKLYFPQLRKQALIVDVRGNGGGFVSPLIIERLRRALVMVEMSRNGIPTPNPADTFTGPMTTLLDEFSASDGDIFPYRFKTLGLGKLIGKRSWGGVIGIRESLPLADGGFLFKPEFAPYARDGSGWVVESHGVDPDIVVDNDPTKEFHGEDQQLDKAIEVILEELKTKAYELPPIPPYPNRNTGPNGGF